MYINSQNQLYQGDMAIGDREATEEEVDAWVAARTPDPKDLIRAQIRALEAQYSDAQAKLTRQSLLVLALDKMCADPMAAGMTREQVHSVLMAGSNGYAALWNLEQTVAALRAQL